MVWSWFRVKTRRGLEVGGRTLSKTQHEFRADENMWTCESSFLCNFSSQIQSILGPVSHCSAVSFQSRTLWSVKGNLPLLPFTDRTLVEIGNLTAVLSSCWEAVCGFQYWRESVCYALVRLSKLRLIEITGCN